MANGNWNQDDYENWHHRKSEEILWSSQQLCQWMFGSPLKIDGVGYRTEPLWLGNYWDLFNGDSLLMVILVYFNYQTTIKIKIKEEAAGVISEAHYKLSPSSLPH